MRLPTDHNVPLDRVLLLLALALFLFASPLLGWWARETTPWYVPYLIWGVLIALTAWLYRRRRK